MSKLNQIEQKLSALNGAEFQKLGDTFLHKILRNRGQLSFNSIGSVTGENKTKTGTPDTLITLETGQHIFVEYTTTKNNIYKKFDKDLDKCFNPKKTGILLDKIDEVILFYNAKMTAKEEGKLRQKCTKNGTTCSIFNLNTIALSLQNNYPIIAKDFLLIAVDTGQILDIEDFIKRYEQNALTTPLDTAFSYRENELSEILELINTSNITVITGHAGVGKTRLALQSCQKYVETNPDVELKCIYFNGQNLCADLRDYFSTRKQYIVFVDDANRNTNLEYITELLHQEHNIKIVLTVRNYAISKIEQTLEQHTHHMSDKNIEAFTNDEIKKLVQEEYEISNPDYLERISHIANGNPRIAFMTAKIAKDEDSLESIRNVENVYDTYFKSIKNDISGLNDDILKVACIVVFFRAIERSNREMMTLITETFTISEDAFWEAVTLLHDIEIFDLYENDIVKVSDQVLATYLFFLGVFREKKVSFAFFMDNFFLTHKERVKDAIYPVLTAFDNKSLVEEIEPVITRLFRDAEDDNVKSDLASIFFFILPTKTLLFLKQHIDGLIQEDIDISTLDFTVDFKEFSISNNYLKILSLFSHSEEQNYKIAIDLAFQYIETQPSKMQTILYIFIHSFGYTRQSNYSYETLLLKKIWDKTNNGNNELFTRMFIAISNYFLKTEFSETQAYGREVSTAYYKLHVTDKLEELRVLIWKNLFEIYKKNLYQNEILQVLYQYCNNHAYQFDNIDNTDILQIDAPDVLNFIQQQLNPLDYEHCVIAQNIFKFYLTKGIDINTNIAKSCKNETYIIEDIIFENKQRLLKMSGEKYDIYHREEVEKYIHSLDYKELLSLLKHIEKIQSSTFKINQRNHQFEQNILTVFSSIYTKDSTLFLSVLEIYLKYGNNLKIAPHSLIEKLVVDIGFDKTYSLLLKHNYQQKNRWLFDCLAQVPPEHVSAQNITILLDLYRVAEASEIPSSLDFLAVYYAIDTDIYFNITKILIDRTTDSNNFLHGLKHIFDGTLKLDIILNNDVDLIEKTYFLLDEHVVGFDYEGKVFNQLLNHDLDFMNRYLEYKISNESIFSTYDENRSFVFLWQRDDVHTVMNTIIHYIAEKKLKFLTSCCLSSFFKNPRDSNRDILYINDKQKKYISKFIEEHSTNIDKLVYIFNFIARLSVENRHTFILEFLQRNQNYSDFQKISITYHNTFWRGSAVSMYQRTKNELTSLLNKIEGLPYLEHRQYIEQYIKDYNQRIKDTKKRDFLRD